MGGRVSQPRVAAVAGKCQVTRSLNGSTRGFSEGKPRCDNEVATKSGGASQGEGG